MATNNVRFPSAPRELPLEGLTFECPICTESVDVDLRVYPCQHFGCSDCIGRLPKEPNNPYIFKCPECRRLVNIPPEGLPVHRDAQRINKRLQEIQERQDSFYNQHEAANERTPLVCSGSQPSNVPQQTDVYLAEYMMLLENDTRCDLDCNCHTSCRICGRRLQQNIVEVYTKVEDNSWSNRSFPILLLPFWMFCLMKTVNPCCAVFNPNAKVQNEPKDIIKLREGGAKAILDIQQPIFPNRLRLLWPFVMLALHTVSVAFNIYHIIIDEYWILPTVAGSINLLLVILWIIFTILTLTSYKPSAEENNQVIHGNNSMSHFSMEQLQIFVSELSVYPQLCMSAILLPAHKVIAIPPFSFATIVLLAVCALRLYTVVKLSQYASLFFGRLVSAVIGNFLVNIFLVVILAVTSFNEYVDEQQFPFLIQCSLSALLLISTPLNLCMFYIAHLYEISLQSGLNMLTLNVGNSYQLVQLARRLTSYEPFHKNLYAMSSPFCGTVLYFWILPSIAVMMITLFVQYQHSIPLIWMFLGYVFFLLLVNHKALLLTAAAHFTSFVILISFTFVCFLSLLAAAVIYTPIIVAATVLIIGFMIVICCGILKECCSDKR